MRTLQIKTEERAEIRHRDRQGIMDRVFKIGVFFLLFVLLFTGCSLDSENSAIHKINYGRVERKTVDGEMAMLDGLCIRLDNGTLLEVMEQLVSTSELDNGSRLKFNYTELGKESNEGGERYYIRLHNYTKLESDVVIHSGDLSEGPIEEIWRDPITIEDIWLGGRYLNVDFSIRKGVNSKERHEVRLVYDEVGSSNTEEKGLARLYIKHNANGDVPTEENISTMVLVRNFISFDILSLIPEGDKSIKIEICWLEEGDDGPLGEPVRRELRGEFTPYNTAQENRWTNER